MNPESILPSEQLPADRLKDLYKRHFNGAFARSGASLIMWTFAFVALIAGTIKTYQLIGISVSIVYLILMNLPILFVMKYVTRRQTYRYFSILVNQLEIIGYTAVIYFAGGIQTSYLALMYGILITYVGVVTPRVHSFIVASLCTVTYSVMIGLVFFGFIPDMYSGPYPRRTGVDQLVILSVIVGLLYVMAYISATSASLLRMHRKKLSHNNEELTKANETLRLEIEERMHVENALRESEDKYRNILQSIEEGYYEVDIAGNFTFFNDSMCTILGYSRDELMGMNNRQYMDEKTARDVFQAFNKVYRTDKSTKAFGWKLIRKDASDCFVEASISLIKDPKDQSTGFRGVVRDSTERRLMEEEKEKLKSQLQRAQKMEAIGTLAGGVAHDLNNILSGLVSYPELLLMEIPENSPLRKAIFTIQKSGEKAAAIVQDLLTLARRGVMTTKVINLNDIISEYLKSPEYEKLVSYHPGVVVVTNLKKGLLNIIGSSVHLTKTLMNLVTNAAEAMPNGGKILISTENQYIDKPIRGYDNVEEGDYVVLSISDNGIGILPEDMERIFEPFYTKKIMGRSGTGLGMAVVWGTVKDHNGYIDLKSSKGKGTTITLYFPITRQESIKEKSRISMENYLGKGESILVVDDVEEQREIACASLAKLGYSVDAVSSGEEAIEYLKKKSMDLVVLDMIMQKGINGRETYEEILKIHPKQKAIIASGFTETEDVKAVQQLGAGKYIKKPYTIDKIGMAVKEELEKS